MNSKVPRKKRNQILIFISVIVFVLVCVCVVLMLASLFYLFNNNSEGTNTSTLSAEETFNVSAVNLIKMEGYTLTSAVCEVVSSEKFLPLSNIAEDQIVFHAFRISGPDLNSETVLLFFSNHTAENGMGTVSPVNAEAIRLFPDFPEGSSLSYPITLDTAGAQTAMECAQQAGIPPTLEFGNFDIEAWRAQAIEMFGPEQTFDDGSKDDYVRYALSICEYKRDNPSMVYTEGSFQQFVLDTFCPYVENH